jgi:predicted ATP-dependent serine protease
MSSKAFREMTYPAITFQSKWGNFFGEPSTTFHLVVHGKPGEGKSTFCIQFAYYLAKHHGNTIYISGEEGFSKTLQLKVNMMNAEHPRLFFTDLKSCDEIKAEIKNDKFHFIFMDSLDTLGINAEKMRELKKLYPASAFITISQSTKAGGMRGSQEIIHDADIEVYIRNGIAVTNKNRFKEKGRELNVFQQIKKKDKDDKINKLGNII